MQCIKEFVFYVLGIMVVLKLFSCFLFVFAYFCFLICLCLQKSVFPFLHTHSMEGRWKFDREERS